MVEAKMDVMRSLQYPARNPGWFKKLLLWVLAMAGGVTIPLAYGYLVRIIRNVARGNEFLPSYADWKQLYSDGLRVIGSLFVIFMPLGLLFAVTVLGTGIVKAQASDTLPGVLATLAGQLAVRSVQGVYLAFLIVFCPIVYICVAYSSQWYAGLNFALMKRLVAGNIVNYVLLILVAYAVVAMSYFGVFLAVIGFVFTLGYALMCTSHMYGVYLRSRLLDGECALME